MTLPDAEQLCTQLAAQIRPHLRPDSALVGIHSGGVWIAERLRALLGSEVALGSIDISFYRDDYGSRGLHPHPQKSGIPFDVNGRHLILVDDVLYTGRTTRAALNELFDYGRPGCVELAVLVDRGERELPICARYCAHTLSESLPAGTRLSLVQDDAGHLRLESTSA
ncbi:MAG: bifunctional pyr operon transcriptional regulator/uracil phosphoribosyltransferase [Candidatus Dactylopiibacterium carminicum]|uniref:Bifunctional pyr operon transcriptional regulator/uracil phosphoribosyltransferase n=1 Tax=Candidatus Dactylopiibacterium carminicum TaxID=857335 RepID=A0A272EPK7_9RHOO|nr:bifunctional pyr operon transcriptional regulator/uracil phosphoribosyltransferase PyrR [Candidatus Dactylopiibacterium carminicum]KAF7598477.1 bifunctional pyr operon transcriptional regulator/uracil phosphoribosyltransferase PyrR [Candidatus Dactylopiibacterium carminicum]PAS92072.1 MAG: bifunctional pyr operon transcriptional regulator/uracil phosphoribosyltransferase [Candidatus Dactylopiibacterium carminicum]PAS95494.1 MAG: bifunctional pyr operon transcriptional regulator/uracil phospho